VGISSNCLLLLQADVQIAVLCHSSPCSTEASGSRGGQGQFHPVQTQLPQGGVVYHPREQMELRTPNTATSAVALLIAAMVSPAIRTIGPTLGPNLADPGSRQALTGKVRLGFGNLA
jgi:hypothetical protein